MLVSRVLFFQYRDDVALDVSDATSLAYES